MKKLGQVIALSFAFIAGIVAGGSSCYLYFDHAAMVAQADNEAGLIAEHRYICVAFHQAALYQRAGLYHQKFGRWPTNVKDLVEAHFLPEFSQVHMCPSEFGTGIENLGNDHVGDFSFVDKNVPAAYYTHSPYQFHYDGTNFMVICMHDESHRR